MQVGIVQIGIFNVPMVIEVVITPRLLPINAQVDIVMQKLVVMEDLVLHVVRKTLSMFLVINNVRLGIVIRPHVAMVPTENHVIQIILILLVVTHIPISV